MAEECKTCRFYLVSQPGSAEGVCRERSPMPAVLGFNQPRLAHVAPTPVVQGFFPPVREDIWCGRYQAITTVATPPGMPFFNPLSDLVQ